MTKEIEFNDVPAFASVKVRVNAVNPDVEFVKAGLDTSADTYVLQLQLTQPRRTTLRLSKELLEDLNGKHSIHRNSELELNIRSAIDRIK